jgi:hypothetical protein
MLEEALEAEYIHENPARKVEPLKTTGQGKRYSNDR